MQNDNISEVLKALSKNGIDKDKMGGSAEQLISSLSAEQQQKLNSILNDKAKTEQILSSPMAKQLLKTLLGKNNG